MKKEIALMRPLPQMKNPAPFDPAILSNAGYGADPDAMDPPVFWTRRRIWTVVAIWCALCWAAISHGIIAIVG